MAEIIKNSQQDIEQTLAADTLTKVDFKNIQGLAPNVFQIYNYGTSSIAVGLNPNVTANENYDFICAGGAITVYADPLNRSSLYFLAAGECKIRIKAWVGNNISTSELSQTTNTTIINSTVTSSVSIANPLPTGTNAIGIVGVKAGVAHMGSVSLDAEIPAGTKHIGGVVIDAEIPAGTKHIGSVSVDAEIPVGTKHIGSVSVDAEIPAGTKHIGEVAVNVLPALVAGSALIGKVNVGTMDNFPTAAPVLYNLALTNANQEYSQAITAAHKIGISIQGGSDGDTFRLAYVTGKVATPTAPYLSFAQNGVYWIDGLGGAGITLYLASSVAGKVAQIEIW